MQYIFFAVIFVMLVLNAFMFIVVKQLSATVSMQIRKDAARLFAIYDSVLEEKSVELEKQEQLRETAISLDEKQEDGLHKQGHIQPFIKGNSYVDRGFSDGYHAIKQAFSFDKKKIISNLSNGQQSQDGKVASEILDEISFDMIYKISLLPSAKQFSLLEAVLEGKKRELLLSLNEDPQTFTAITFYEQLKLLAKSKSGSIYVRTANQEECYEGLGENIVVEYSETLCDGVQIIADGHLYDYSIIKKEIG